MHNVTTSRHIRSATELFLMVPLKQDFVPISELVMTYSSRVTAVLSALFDIRQQKVERGFGEPIGPIERLSTIYRVQWSVLEPFDEQFRATPDSASWRQLHRPQLILTSHFDSSWEDYFSDLVTTGAGLLDLIFSHCEGYEGNTCQDGYEAFSNFIRRHQRPCNFMYAGSPEVSVDDMRFFTAFTTGTLDPDSGAIPRIEDEADSKQKAAAQQEKFDDQTLGAYKAIFGLHDVRERLFSDDFELKGRTGRTLFDAAVRSVLELEPDFARLKAVVQVQQGKAEKAHAEAEAKRSGYGPAAPLPPIPAPLRWGLSLLKQEAGPEHFGQPKPAAPDPHGALDQANVQGNVLSGYDTAKWATLLLLRCNGTAAFKSLLHGLPNTYTSEAENQRAKALRGKSPAPFVNLALTFEGLKRLRLPAEVLAQFPREFQEGMEERAGVLGDVSENHPEYWQRPFCQAREERIALNIVDAAMTVHATNKAEGSKAITELKQLLKLNGIEVLYELPLFRSAEAEASQPIPQGIQLRYGATDRAQAKRDERPLGDFLLGYRDSNDRTSASADPERKPVALEIFRDGTFIAMRKMFDDRAERQRYVEGTLAEIQAQSGRKPGGPTSQDVEAWFVGGREQNGRFAHPLEPEHGSRNEFDYSQDPNGDACPLHSHVRRANPRQRDTPRIARRGLSYAETQPNSDAQEKGLLFMAYCANLAEQYEIVQRYVNGANSTGLTSLQNDLLCGAPNWGNVERRSAAFQDERGGPPRKVPLPARGQPLVRLRWGLYLFVPSLTALQALSKGLDAPEACGNDRASVTRGALRIKQLARLSETKRAHEWTRLLEEVAEADSAQAREALDIWAAIRSHEVGGALRILDQREIELEDIFPGGVVVVGTEALARKVLGDDGTTFSVVEYRRRLRASAVDHYIAHDPAGPHAGKPGYASESDLPNRIVRDLQREAYAEARKAASAFLLEPGSYQQEPQAGETLDGRPRSAVSIRDLARVVVAQLCEKWFGLPRLPEPAGLAGLVASLERFLLSSRYSFQASPGAHLIDDARRQGATIRPSYKALQGDFAEALEAEKYPHSLEQAVIGAVVGFAPPAVGAITRVLDQWIENGELWRIRAQIARDAAERNANHRGAIYRALSRTPSPPLLYRKAIQNTVLGKVNVLAGTQIVIGLTSVYLDAERRNLGKPEAWLFGGDRGLPAPTPTHGCPARDAGTDVILGIVQALFERRNIRRERRLVVSYDAG